MFIVGGPGCGTRQVDWSRACSSFAARCKWVGDDHWMPISVRILGPVMIGDSGDSVALSPKLRLLLGLLAAHRGSVVSVDRLCDALWGDDQPSSPGATLQSHLSRLRRLVEPSARIVGLDRGYRLDLPEGALDVDHFVHLAQTATDAPSPAEAVRLYGRALAFWRGPAFGDLHDAEWIRPEAVRLDELRLTVVESFYECRLSFPPLMAYYFSRTDNLRITFPILDTFQRTY